MCGAPEALLELGIAAFAIGLVSFPLWYANHASHDARQLSCTFAIAAILRLGGVVLCDHLPGVRLALAAGLAVGLAAGLATGVTVARIMHRRTVAFVAAGTLGGGAPVVAAVVGFAALSASFSCNF